MYPQRFYGSANTATRRSSRTTRTPDVHSPLVDADNTMTAAHLMRDFGRKLEDISDLVDFSAAERQTLAAGAEGYARQYTGDRDFMCSMREAVIKWGTLTDGQMKGVLNCLRTDRDWVPSQPGRPSAPSRPCYVGYLMESLNAQRSTFFSLVAKWDAMLGGLADGVAEGKIDQERYDWTVCTLEGSMERSARELGLEISFAAILAGGTPNLLVEDEEPVVPITLADDDDDFFAAIASADVAQLTAVVGEQNRLADMRASGDGLAIDVVTPVTKGYYTVVDTANDSHITLRVGKGFRTDPENTQVIAYLYGSCNTSDYVGFAHVKDGVAKVWGKMRGETRAITALRHLIGAAEEGRKEAGKLYAVESGNCAKCGRLLTDEKSIAAGLGPTCRGE